MADLTHDLPASNSAEPRATPSLARSTAVMSAGTALSRLTGFLRIAVMAWALGAAESKVADTYNLANSMPNIVYQLVLGEILATIFVPVFVEYITTRDLDESWTLASSVLNIALIIAAAFSALTVALAPWLIKIYTFNLPHAVRAQQEAVGAFWLRIFMPQMLFYAAGAVLTGLLNAYRKFGVPMFAPILNNAIVIVTFVIFGIEHRHSAPQLGALTAWDKWLLGGGTTLGVIAMTLILMPYVRGLPGRYRLRAAQWRHPAIRHVGNLAKYSLGYVVVNQIGLWVMFALANRREGGVTAFNYAWILFQLPYGIYAVSVMTYIVREVSEHKVRGDLAAIRDDVSLGLRSSSFIVLPATAGFIALAHPLIAALLQHGAFGRTSASLTADTLIWMALSLGAFTAFQQVMRAFYAMQDTKTPLGINVVATLVNIVTAYPFFRMWGVPGLAASFTVMNVVGCVYGALALRRRIGGLDGKRLAGSHARIVAASAATGLAAWLAARAFGTTVASDQARIAQIAAAVVAGAIVYIGAARVMRIDELRPLLAIIRGRFGRKATT